MQERALPFRGRCCRMNGIIKYSFSLRKREKDLAPHQDDAALSVWFLQTTTVTLSGCLSDPLSTVCSTLWYFQPNSVGKQMSSRNESHYKFSVDWGKEDWSICHFGGKGCCVNGVDEKDRASVGLSKCCRLPDCCSQTVGRDEGGV